MRNILNMVIIFIVINMMIKVKFHMNIITAHRCSNNILLGSEIL